MNVADIVFKHANHPENRPLLAELSGTTRCTRDFGIRAQRLAAGLRQRGIGPGAAVAILSRNSIAYVEILFGIFAAGCIAVPLNIRWSAEEISYALDDADVVAIFVDDSCLQSLTKLDTIGLPPLVFRMGDPSGAGTFLCYEDLVRDEQLIELSIGSDAPCLICYTGGTTGTPKGVVHTHASVLASALNLAASGIPGRGCRYLMIVPLFHISGLGVLIGLIMQGVFTIIPPAFSLEGVHHAVTQLGANEMGAVPTMLQMMLSHEDFRQEGARLVRHIYYGASPISASLLEEVMDVFSNAALTQLYGMTEVGIPVILPPETHVGDNAKREAAGIAGPLYAVRIEDPSGQVSATGDVGEIVFYGAGCMTRYHNKPDETGAVLRHGGVRSGDIGYMDEAGTIYLLDRAKDLIISGGENVYSIEVEKAIADHADVAQVAVIGIPHPIFGESIHAIIVPKKGALPSLEAIRGHCRKRIAGYKCPSSLEIREALPLSATNKVLKAQLREPHWREQSRSIS